MLFRAGIGCLALSTLCLLGCGGPGLPPMHPVSGTVTFAGKPIENGSIVFDPVGGQGVAAMGTIENGQIKAEVPAGEKILRITAMRETAEQDQYGEVVTESYIPEKYNVNSQIKQTVSADGANQFDIKLD
ncbi:hypothetical protein [Roseimaritima ulvae]|uniref:Carboxypeptidase regulatory-like domain-containing protein n=1 Tax=Roseimaritima ulvae TaxID=980254 RepID=A0A5B9QYX2_9BACT|nr:hypothetical protein [Roseimaritima ulvae]QEG42356.1 hypothetical protein UC8_43900 [Roseimaritima ulvae]